MREDTSCATLFTIMFTQHFCSYDDYNWDWSLGQLGKACSDIKKDFKVLVMKTPRVFHIGTW